MDCWMFFYLLIRYIDGGPPAGEPDLSSSIWRRYSEFELLRNYFVANFPAVRLSHTIIDNCVAMWRWGTQGILELPLLAACFKVETAQMAGETWQPNHEPSHPQEDRHLSHWYTVEIINYNNNNKLWIYIAQFPWWDDQLRITIHRIK